MHRSCIAVGSLALLAGAWVACGENSITACSDEPDVTGAWSLSLSPDVSDAGVAGTIPSDLALDVELEQGQATDFLGIGHYVYGTVTSSDPRYFGSLMIPRLLKNDGSKTGAVLGCELRINVPIAMPVTDDDLDQGPMRIALVGKIVKKGTLDGLLGSHLVMTDDPDAVMRAFTWQGVRR